MQSTCLGALRLLQQWPQRRGQSLESPNLSFVGFGLGFAQGSKEGFDDGSEVGDHGLGLVLNLHLMVSVAFTADSGDVVLLDGVAGLFLFGSELETKQMFDIVEEVGSEVEKKSEVAFGAAGGDRKDPGVVLFRDLLFEGFSGFDSDLAIARGGDFRDELSISKFVHEINPLCVEVDRVVKVGTWCLVLGKSRHCGGLEVDQVQCFR